MTTVDSVCHHRHMFEYVCVTAASVTNLLRVLRYNAVLCTPGSCCTYSTRTYLLIM